MSSAFTTVRTCCTCGSDSTSQENHAEDNCSKTGEALDFAPILHVRVGLLGYIPIFAVDSSFKVEQNVDYLQVNTGELRHSFSMVCTWGQLTQVYMYRVLSTLLWEVNYTSSPSADAECLQRAVEGRAASDEEDEDRGVREEGQCCPMEVKRHVGRLQGCSKGSANI